MLFLTEGVLLRQLSSREDGGDLSQYNCVILDEVHERSTSIDLLIALLRELCYRRADLKLILMSATINIELFTAYFPDAPLIQVIGDDENRPREWAGFFSKSGQVRRSLMDRPQSLFRTPDQVLTKTSPILNRPPLSIDLPPFSSSLSTRHNAALNNVRLALKKVQQAFDEAQSGQSGPIRPSRRPSR
jgi:hypothetical protein